jgi:hypothetical protein
MTHDLGLASMNSILGPALHSTGISSQGASVLISMELLVATARLPSTLTQTAHTLSLDILLVHRDLQPIPLMISILKVLSSRIPSLLSRVIVTNKLEFCIQMRYTVFQNKLAILQDIAVTMVAKHYIGRPWALLTQLLVMVITYHEVPWLAVDILPSCRTSITFPHNQRLGVSQQLLIFPDLLFPDLLLHHTAVARLLVLTAKLYHRTIPTWPHRLHTHTDQRRRRKRKFQLSKRLRLQPVNLDGPEAVQLMWFRMLKTWEQQAFCLLQKVKDINRVLKRVTALLVHQ